MRGRIQGAMLIAIVGSGGLWMSACSSLPTPVMPDGSQRTPVNSAASMQNYQLRTAEEVSNATERTALARQVTELNRQMIELRTSVALLQSHLETEVDGERRLITKPSFPKTESLALPASPSTSIGKGGETVEVREQAVTFRVTHPFAKAEFAPSAALSESLIAAAAAARHIEIRGRTDGDRDNAVDRRIASQRARHARQFLIRHGIDAGKIRCGALAAGGHITENRTEAGRARNRRVEIEMMDLDTAAYQSTVPTQLGLAP